MNSNQKIMRFICYLVPVLLVLSLIWHNFTPLLVIALVALFVVARQSGSIRVLGRTSTPPIYYQPKQPLSSALKPEPPPRTNPPLGFDLTAEEYRQLSKTYQQGYQAPAPQVYPKMHQDAKPKQDRSIDDYEQPQAHYEQMPPPLA